MIPPFIYVSRCGLRRTAYCSGREETRCAEICQQRVELLDDVLYACRIGNSCRRARIARSSRARRTCGTGRTNSARCSFNTLRPLRAGGTRCAGRTDCACCTRNTLWADGARRSGRGDVKRKVAITLKNQGEIKNKRLSHYAESRPGKTGRLFCVVGLERRKIFLVEN